MLLYGIFLLSYTVFSTYCYYIDIYTSSLEIRNENIKKYDKAINIVTFNVVVVSYLFFYSSQYIYNPRDFDMILSIRDLVISTYNGQILFYTIHRIFHNISFLTKYHKYHHQFREPIGIRAAYTHPIDFFMGNLIPIGITPFLLNTDIYTTCIFIIYSVYSTIVVEHSNYNNDNQHHIDHHRNYKYNYGAKWIDNFMGTSLFNGQFQPERVLDLN